MMAKRTVAFLLLVCLFVIETPFYSSAETENSFRVALTFDDGPHPRYTDMILDVLSEHDIFATFFVIGKNVENYPKPFLRTIAEGHEIGNHTYSHPHMRRLSEEAIAAEIAHCQNVIEQVGGISPTLFRPPEGYSSEAEIELLQSIGITPIFWDVDTRDWAGNDATRIARIVSTSVNADAIILFHDYVSCKNTTVNALREIIPALKKRGAVFCTVSEMINEKAVNH